MTFNRRWDVRGLRLAREIASWSKDPSTRVGCVVLNPETHLICATGYNGFPRGIADDARLYDRETKLAIILHAEANALLHTIQPVRGGHLYLWPFLCCIRCAAFIVQAGITRVIAPRNDNPRWQADFEQSLRLFGEAAVDVLLIHPLETGLAP